MNNYEQEIWRVLLEAGNEGLSIRKISRHVFNAHNSFFSAVSYDDVHSDVAHFLLRQSQRKKPFVERVRHGVYRLNLKNEATRCLLPEYKDLELSAEKSKRPAEDLSLSLF